MKRIIPCLGLIACLFTNSASAWNLSARGINALQFEKSGKIVFTLFENGMSGPEFLCGTGANSQWFYVSACSAADSVCLASVNRMASMLLSAKLAGKQVHVLRNNCEVTAAALKP
jgi:hypothetical protein